MRQVSQGVKDALWLGNLITLYDLYTIATDAAGTHYWTSASANVVIGGTTWYAGIAPTIDVPRGLSDLGFADDAREVIIGPADLQMPNGSTVQKCAMDGAFDSATFKWERAIATTGAIVDKVVQFDGLIVDVQPRSTSVRFRVKSRTHQLTLSLPERRYQTQCQWVFGSAECGHTKLTGETCDHTMSDTTGCLQYVGTLVRFGGYPYIPSSEVSAR